MLSCCGMGLVKREWAEKELHSPVLRIPHF